MLSATSVLSSTTNTRTDAFDGEGVDSGQLGLVGSSRATGATDLPVTYPRRRRQSPEAILGASRTLSAAFK